jgi:hypothetical protein
MNLQQKIEERVQAFKQRFGWKYVDNGTAWVEARQDNLLAFHEESLASILQVVRELVTDVQAGEGNAQSEFEEGWETACKSILRFLPPEAKKE